MSGPRELSRRLASDPVWRSVRLLDVSWPRVLAAVAAGAGGLGSAVALAAVSAWLIARASQMPPVMQLSIAAVAVRTFGISRGLLRYLERLVSHDVALRGMARLRTTVYRSLAEGRTEHLMGLRRGDLLARVGSDVDDVGDVVVRGLLPAAVAAVVGAGSVVLIAAFLPSAALVLGGCLVLAGIGAPWLAARAARRVEEDSAEARAETSALALAVLDGAGELAVAGRVDEVLRELDRSEADLARATDRGARAQALAAATLPLSTGLAVLGALVLGVPATTAGALTPVELAVVVLTPLAAFEAVALLPQAAVQVHRSRHAARRVLELIDGAADPGAHGVSHLTGAHGAPDLGSPGEPARLTARGLACGWPGGPVLLRDLDVALTPGRSVAVVGPSGTGKTTLLLTLAGLMPPRGGKVVHAGRPRDGEGASGPLVALTTEDAHVFDTTVLENLRVARGDLTASDARGLLDAVGLGTWLAGLDDGLDTVLGSDGTAVSGGERRRLLVARTLASPAPLLLLDEPTEHLDTAAGAFMAGLLSPGSPMTGGRGVLVVTHRLAGTEHADEVILLGPDGAVLARGPHRDILDAASSAAFGAAWQSETQETP